MTITDETTTELLEALDHARETLATFRTPEVRARVIERDVDPILDELNRRNAVG